MVITIPLSKDSDITVSSQNQIQVKIFYPRLILNFLRLLALIHK